MVVCSYAVSVVGGGAQANLFEIEPRKGEELTASDDVAARVRVLIVAFRGHYPADDDDERRHGD